MKNLLFLVSFFLLTTGAQATIITVDSINNAGTGSLRAAVALASNGDTIRFNPNLISLGSDSIVLSSRINIDKDLKIVGLYSPTDTLFLSGGGSTGVFWAWGGNSYLILDSLVIVNGGGFRIALEINNCDSVSIKNCVLKNCDGEGVLSVSKARHPFSVLTSDLKVAMYMDNCIIQNNRCNYAGVVIFTSSDNNKASVTSQVWVSNSLFSSNIMGGIHCFAGVQGSDTNTAVVAVEIENCEFINNTIGPSLNVQSNSGNSISESASSALVDLNVKNSRFIGNQSGFPASGLRVHNESYSKGDLKLQVTKSLFEDNIGRESGAFHVFGSQDIDVVIDSCQVSNNLSWNDGGGITIECDDPKLNGSRAVTINNTVFKDNRAQDRGGAIYIRQKQSSSNQTLNEVNLDKCTFSNNSTDSLTGGAITINCWGANGYVSSLNVNRTTFYENHAHLNGGAISLLHYGSGIIQTEVKNSTFFQNESPLVNGIHSYAPFVPNTLNVSSSMFFNSGGINKSISDSFSLSFSSGGYNIFSDSVMVDTVSSDQINIDSTSLNLGALTFNGGTTKTVMPISPSVAINMGNPLDSNDAQNVPIMGIRDVGAAEVCAPTFEIDTVLACDSYTWMDGITYIVNDTLATYTMVNAAGCDSLVSLHLTINYATNFTDTIVACDSYTWLDGITYNLSNSTAQHITPNSVGCDSVITLHLTIKNSTTFTDSIVACDSYTWVDGNTYTSSNAAAKDTLINAMGCDSIVSLNLTINYSNTFTDTITACNSYTWIDGNTYTSNNNSVKDTLTNASGCDSVVTLNLTIHNTTFYTDSIVACNSYTWTDGIAYTSNNTTAKDTLVNSMGCDSIVTLNLIILNSSYGLHVVTVCDNYLWNGVNYTSSNNTALDTLVNAAGCDSIITLNLTINSSSAVVDSTVACLSYTWIDGINYIANNNTATHTLTNTLGCDSVVSLNLSIYQPTASTDVIVACDSLTWLDGVTYTQSNNSAVFNTVDVHGCDSVVSLDLTINSSASSTEVISACDSYIWIDGVTYTQSNFAATHILQTVSGCDSIVGLNLSILSSSSYTDTHVVCDAMTWIDGNTYTTNNNTATHTLTNAAGCDSVVALDLTILANSGTEVVAACESYLWNGITYTSSNNTALDTLTNAAGCDSIVTLDLTILNSNTGTEIITACDSYTWNGNTYTSSSTAFDTLVNTVGCDSIVILDLTITHSSSSTDIITACDSYLWIDGITYTSSTQSATYTLSNAVGCDSVITLNLIINEVDTSVITQELTLTAQAANASYRWLDCSNNNQPITNEISNVFTVTQSGNYALEVTQNGCVDTSACFEFTNVGIAEMELIGISLYPNPTSDFLHIDKGANQSLDIVITNNAGGEVFRTTSNNQITLVDMSGFATGIYVVSMQNQDGVKIEQVVKR